MGLGDYLKPEVGLECCTGVLTYKTIIENEILWIISVKIFTSALSILYCMQAEQGGGWGKGSSQHLVIHNAFVPFVLFSG